MATGKETSKLEGHTCLINSIAISPDGKTICLDQATTPTVWTITPSGESSSGPPSLQLPSHSYHSHSTQRPKTAWKLL
jgi:hypothetical protein